MSAAPVNDEVVDALFGFLTSIQSHHQHVGGSLVGAGIVPVLIDLIAHAPKDRFQHATRAVQFLETAFYASTNAATAFFGANGVPLYISRIKACLIHSRS